MKAPVLFLFFLFFLSTTCRKDPTFTGPATVSGKVLSRHTNEPLPNRPVYVRRLEKEAPDAFSMKTVAIGQADKDGNYKIDFTIEREYNYYVMAEGDTYYFNSTEDRLDLTKDASAKKDILLDVKGWIRFNLINQPPMERIDFGINSTSENYYGIINDTSIYLEMWGGQNRLIVWFIRNSSGTETYSENLYFPPLDTALYEIKY